MKELFDLLLQNFQTTKKQVNQLLAGGIIFTVFYFVYVTVPYFQFQVYKKEAEQVRKTVEEKIQTRTDDFKLIESVHTDVQDGLKQVRSRIQSFPDHLNQQALPEIARVLEERVHPQPQQFQQQQLPASQLQFNQGITSQGGLVSLPGEVEDFEGAVHWYIQNWFRTLVLDLKTIVITPILKLKDVTADTVQFDIDAFAETTITKIQAHLDAVDPDFWRSYAGGKVPMAEALRQEVDQSFTPIRDTIDGLLVQSTDSLEALQASLGTLQGRLKDVDAGIVDLDERIAAMKSPFGPIPLNVTELIIVFPVLLVILIVLVTTLFNKSIRLYGDLWRHLSEERTDPEQAKAEIFLQYTDCWYLPPYATVIQPVLLIAYAVVTVGIFITVALLVLQAPELFRLPIEGITQYRNSVFGIAYGVGMILIGWCSWVSVHQLVRLSRLSIGDE